MTDKQIIIDGVDVVGCEYFNRFRNICHNKNLCCDCKKNQDCYYKQLKRKEQEYEELRQYHNKCCEENAKKEAEWLEKYNQVSRGFYNGNYCNTEHCNLLKAKEQECERLKEEVSLLKESNSKLQQIEDVNSLEKCYLQQLDQLKAENEKLK